MLLRKSWHLVDLNAIPGGIVEYLLGHSNLRQSKGPCNMQTPMLTQGMPSQKVLEPCSQPLPCGRLEKVPAICSGERAHIAMLMCFLHCAHVWPYSWGSNHIGIEWTPLS